LGAAGVVNVVTKSGGNDFHGQLFGNDRDKGAGIATFPGGQANPYSREVCGGNVGGPISKDKLFYLLVVDYSKHERVAPVVSCVFRMECLMRWTVRGSPMLLRESV